MCVIERERDGEGERGREGERERGIQCERLCLTMSGRVSHSLSAHVDRRRKSELVNGSVVKSDRQLVSNQTGVTIKVHDGCP